MIIIVEEKIKALDAKKRKTVKNIEMLMENMKGVAVAGQNKQPRV